MARTSLHLSGKERTFPEDEIIVSKTDPKGRITYANDIFQQVAGYTEPELIGQPHSIVRHPAMPRCVFKLLWNTIQNGQEIFAYVLNRAKNGDHYWVLAHVTPNVGPNGEIIGFHSNRRLPRRESIAAVEPLYRLLREEEERHDNAKVGMDAAGCRMTELLAKEGKRYDEFVLDL